WDCFHRHDEIEFTFFATGEPIRYRFGGTTVELRNKHSILFWGAIPHQLVDLSPENVQYWLTIPPEMFFRWDLPKNFVRQILDGKMLTEVDSELRALDLLSFPVWLRETDPTDAE